MLSELTISNFAIIERQSLSFHRGFNVISGETGAGKSIILNALEFILGAKGSPSLIRTGADSLEVQALFDLSVVAEEVRQTLPEIVGSDDELVVSRTLPREGRGKVLINGRLGTVALLEEIVRKLVNICSQHHQTRLLDARFHLELLDGFSDSQTHLEEMRVAYRAWADKKDEAARLRSLREQGSQRREELEALVAELEALPNLRAGRRLELDGEIKRISNFERLLNASERAIDLMAGEDGLATRLKEIAHALVEVSRLDATAHSMVTEFEAGRQIVADSELALRRYVQSLEFDEAELESLREQLSEIARLERKYKTDDAGLCALMSRSQEELKVISNSASGSHVEQELERLYSQAQQIALKLRKQRHASARELCRAVSKDLSELNMLDASLEVRFSETEPTSVGTDRVEFLISTNKGEPHSPLIQIASGGELSRVMLVLKKILRERSGVNVLIFDEVDSGISGGVARSVGLMLKEISAQSQVVCITHLPQVASLSDRHFLVNKEIGDRAVTVVRQLTDEEKVEEIARMLAGYRITEASRASARELIGTK